MLPFTLQFTSQSPTQDLNESDMRNLSLSLDVRMLRTFFFATATNFPFTLHSTMTEKSQNKKELNLLPESITSEIQLSFLKHAEHMLNGKISTKTKKHASQFLFFF